MRVRHFCYYLTDWSGITPRPEDWATNKIAKCVQGQPIEGYVDVRVGGSDLRVDNDNKSEFLRRLWIAVGQSLAATLTTHRAIVPIPNGSAIISSSGVYRTLQYAQAIAAASSGKMIALDALRWKAPAEAGYKKKGLRTPESRYDNLTVIKCPKIPIILFDDVLTSGSCFIAANWRLSEAGNFPAEGFVVARRTAIQEPKMVCAKRTRS